LPEDGYFIRLHAGYFSYMFQRGHAVFHRAFYRHRALRRSVAPVIENKNVKSFTGQPEAVRKMRRHVLRVAVEMHHGAFGFAFGPEVHGGEFSAVGRIKFYNLIPLAVIGGVGENAALRLKEHIGAAACDKRAE